MIEGQYVSFETAKLAKEKGFDGKTHYGFSKRNLLLSVKNGCNWNKDEFNCSLSTQSLLARWLREKYDLSVEVYSTASGFAWCVCKVHDGTCIVSSEDYDEDIPDNYETSMEIALQKALKFIKKEQI